jgi:hypothetical protein
MMTEWMIVRETGARPVCAESERGSADGVWFKVYIGCADGDGSVSKMRRLLEHRPSIFLHGWLPIDDFLRTCLCLEPECVLTTQQFLDRVRGAAGTTVSA